jgi:hypothetical protein
LVAAVDLVLLVAFWPLIAPVNDVVGFIAGGRAILAGIDPYDPERWTEFATAVGQRPETRVFGYPPWVALAFAPLAALPTPVASLVWTVGTHAAALASVVLLGRRLGWPVIPSTVVAGASWPAMLVLLQGQWGFALFALAALCLHSLVLRRDRMAGAALGAMLIAKPQLFLLAAIAIGAWSVAQRRIGVMAAAAAVVGVAIAAGTLAAPAWLAAYAPYVLAPRSVRSTQQPTFAGLAGDIAGEAWPLVWVVLVAVLGALAVAAARGASREQRAGIAFGSVLAISIGAAPYSWSYDHYLALPLALSVLGVATSLGGRGRVLLGVAVAVLVGPLAFGLWQSAYARWHDTLSGLVPALAVVLAWTAVRARPDPDRAP